LDSEGRHVDGDPPTKEVPLHLRMYELRSRLRAVVHLHSPYALAASILEDADPADVLPPLTAYYLMRVGRLPLVPYARPGTPELADLMAEHLGDAWCALLANHGPVAGGADLTDAVNAVEEIEQTARLWLLVAGRPIRPLSAAAVAELAPKTGSGHRSGTTV
jgi:ribulose-5-phosphate 4-epimerase/fuculose-1-phosphate aldolase